jgi:uncharacterized protein (TIGR04141 family)
LSCNGGETAQITVEDVYDLSDPVYLRQLYTKIVESREYHAAEDKQAFTRDAFRVASVVTRDDDGNSTTFGRLKEYLQLELAKDGVSYFLLDNVWYRLQDTFDANLAENYARNIKDKFQTLGFIQRWNGRDENAYNMLYDNQPHSFFLHKIKVDYIELCDVVFIDNPQNTIYILHVKHGLGATIRDLTSQVHMSA